jgi:hypothetical protein
MNQKIIKTLFTTLVVLFFASSSSAKGNNWNILLTSGDTYSHVSLRRLENDSLIIYKKKFIKSIAVDSISELWRKKSKIVAGSTIGLLIGATCGALIGGVHANQIERDDPLSELFAAMDAFFMGLLTGSVIGLSTGAIIGSHHGKSEVYNLSELSHGQKIELLKVLILDKKPAEKLFE